MSVLKDFKDFKDFRDLPVFKDPGSDNRPKVARLQVNPIPEVEAEVVSVSGVDLESGCYRAAAGNKPDCSCQSGASNRTRLAIMFPVDTGQSIGGMVDGQHT